MKPFHFNWKAFSFWPGIKFLVAILILYLLSSFIEFSWFLVGLSAFLAWLVAVVSGYPKNKIIAVVYLMSGALLTFISCHLADHYWYWAFFMFAVAFAGTTILKFGTHWFMLGWGLVYWTLLTPVLNDTASNTEITLSHMIGSGTILMLIYIEDIWKKRKFQTEEPTSSGQENIEWRFVLMYATIMAFVVVGALMIGYRFLDTDITLIANAAFMIIGFNMVGTWKAGLERMLAGLLGIVMGFYLGLYLQNELFGLILGIIFLFMAFNCLFVNNGIIVFLFLGAIGYSYGIKGYDVGNQLANERIIAEFLGILLAGTGITLLHFITKAFSGSRKN